MIRPPWCPEPWALEPSNLVSDGAGSCCSATPAIETAATTPATASTEVRTARNMRTCGPAPCTAGVGSGSRVIRGSVMVSSSANAATGTSADFSSWKVVVSAELAAADAVSVTRAGTTASGLLVFAFGFAEGGVIFGAAAVGAVVGAAIDAVAVVGAAIGAVAVVGAAIGGGETIVDFVRAGGPPTPGSRPAARLELLPTARPAAA
jgi:hypothetical protein